MRSSRAWPRCRRACGRRPPRRSSPTSCGACESNRVSGDGRAGWCQEPRAIACSQGLGEGRTPRTHTERTPIPTCPHPASSPSLRQAWPVQMLCREADQSGAKVPTSGKCRPKLLFWAVSACARGCRIGVRAPELRLLHFIRHGQGFHNSLNDFCKVYHAHRPIKKCRREREPERKTLTSDSLSGCVEEEERGKLFGGPDPPPMPGRRREQYRVECEHTERR